MAETCGDRIRAVGDNWRIDCNLHWAHYNDCGERVSQGSDWVCTPTAEELQRWDALVQHVIRSPYAAIARRQLYIRFGNLPKGGRSRNHATGRTERGTSCYEASIDVLTGTVELVGDGLAGAAILAAFGGYGGVALLIAGEYSGRGSDGEPLVQRPTIVARLERTPDGNYRISTVEAA